MSCCITAPKRKITATGTDQDFKARKTFPVKSVLQGKGQKLLRFLLPLAVTQQLEAPSQANIRIQRHDCPGQWASAVAALAHHYNTVLVTTEELGGPGGYQGHIISTGSSSWHCSSRKLTPLHSNTHQSSCSCTSLKQDTRLILVGRTDNDGDARTSSFNPGLKIPFRLLAKSLSLCVMLAPNQCLWKCFWDMPEMPNIIIYICSYE